MYKFNLVTFTFLFFIKLSAFAGNYGVSYVAFINSESYTFSDNSPIEFLNEKYIEIGVFNPRFDATFGFGQSNSNSLKKETRSINLIYKIFPFDEIKWIQLGLGGYFDISSIIKSNNQTYGINEWYLRTQIGLLKTWDKSSLGISIAPLFKVASPSQSNQNSAYSSNNIKSLVSIYYSYDF